MNFLSLDINSFRNLSSLHLNPVPNFNIICGANGSGKTSILEAVYFLSVTRSFRSSVLSRVIQYEADSFSIIGVVTNEHEQIRVAIEKNRAAKLKIRLRNEDVSSITELTRHLPIKLINPDTYYLLNAGPQGRRQFIDWGLFHVEPNFLPLWRRFQRVLKQRNAALQQHARKEQIQAWNNEFITDAYPLAEFRKTYIDQLLPIVTALLAKAFEAKNLTIAYYPGWRMGSELAEVLETSYSRDAMLGYTQFGPQRADIEVKFNQVPARDILSRGEQKLLVYILQLAQGVLLQQLTGRRCVYLVDDLAAELDNVYRKLIMDILASLNTQVFITTTDARSFDDCMSYPQAQLISLKAGRIVP
jgi:DNA replication and repair protein RecF